MTKQEPIIQRKNSGSVLFFTVFFALMLAICIAVGVLTFVIGPSIYKTISYSYYIVQAAEYFHQRKFNEAISSYSQAITINPNSVDAYIFRGNAYVYLEDYTKAKRDFETAINLDPTSASTYNTLCWYGSLLGDAENLISVCEQAVTLEPNNPHYRDSRGLARALTGDYQGAILDFQYFVNQANVDSLSIPADVKKRESWIASLSKGINPFDSNELHNLLENNGPQEEIPQGDVQGFIKFTGFPI